MNFDFSHLYNKETVEVMDKDTVIFTAVIREVSHGAKTEAKVKIIENLDIPTTKNKKRHAKQMKEQMKIAQRNGSISNQSLFEEVSAIESWTLELDGKPVKVCVEAWAALPSRMCVQIEKVIERLNPDLDDDFRDDDADEGTAE